MKTQPTDQLPTVLHEWQFSAIGTSWWIGLYQAVTAAELAAFKSAAVDLIETYDKNYSRFRADSWVTKLSKQVGSFPLPADASPLFALYRQLYDVTGGAVTPLIGQPLSDAGYDAHYSLQPRRIRQPPAWDEAIQVSDAAITMRVPALLDFGAAGKGYLVDRLCELLQQHGITDYCVDGSGDMRCNFADVSRQAPLVIGLEHPDQPGQVVGTAQLTNGALCGSAGNRRVWGGKDVSGDYRYTHILSPSSLQSPQHLRAVWVTAETALLADGLTTACYFMDPAQLLERFDFEYGLINNDLSHRQSAHFPGQFFAAEAVS